MIRGTTPIHIFEIPFEVSLLEKIEITYSQKNKIVLQKHKEDVGLSGTEITLKLTQEETLKFNTTDNVLIQIRVKTTSGEVLANEIILASVSQVLSEEIL